MACALRGPIETIPAHQTMTSPLPEAVRNESFPALLAFGDSMVDTGNNNYLLTLMKGNYWPYGWNFDSKIPTGRFGNGRVFSDVVAEGLGIKRIVPAYQSFIAS